MLRMFSPVFVLLVIGFVIHLSNQPLPFPSICPSFLPSTHHPSTHPTVLPSLGMACPSIHLFIPFFLPPSVPYLPGTWLGSETGKCRDVELVSLPVPRDIVLGLRDLSVGGTQPRTSPAVSVQRRSRKTIPRRSGEEGREACRPAAGLCVCRQGVRASEGDHLLLLLERE